MANVGYVSNLVIHQMREFSNSGEIITTSDNKDYLLSVVPLINLYQREMSITTHKISKKYEISQNMPDNQLGVCTWNENQVHTNDDISYEGLGSKAYSLQVSGYATVYIEEEILGIWTNLVTISHIPTDGEGYVTYKGLTGVSDTSNQVRIRFSGAYRYLYRWVALFSDNYFSANEVPKYEPFVPYELPIDFYMKDRIDWTYANQQFNDYAEYRLETYENNKKRIFFKYYEKGEFNVHYYAYPAFINPPNPDNVNEQDNVELDIAEEAIPALVHRICSTLTSDEDAYRSQRFSNEFATAMNNLIEFGNYEQGDQNIISNSNW